ncbi:MAG: hypothetical protein ACI81R_001557 [Bradymonadia bacterium]|jgi:hypothetical protein
MHASRSALVCVVFAVTATIGCGESDNEPEVSPYQELYDAGVDRYLGAFEPSEVQQDGEVASYFFDETVEGGPLCMRGAQFHASTQSTGSDDLLIFLKGGGACWSELCFALDLAGEPGIPAFDVFSDDADLNPFAGWNILYVPYCDGSLFAGDVETTNDDGEVIRHHRGLQNLSAALDVGAAQFPDASRVVLAGSSGGGFGTIIGTPLVRQLFPDAELLVVNDAGVGVLKGDEPEFLGDLIGEFNAEPFVPQSCPDCLDNGHLTDLVAWQLENDTELKIASFSSFDDGVISGIFLQRPDGVFESDLRTEILGLAAAYPERYMPFLIQGEQHTILLGSIAGFLGDEFAEGPNPFEAIVSLARMSETTVSGTRFDEWLRWMLNDDPRWVPIIEAAE